MKAIVTRREATIGQGRVHVRPVATRADFRAFMALPGRLHRDDPNWVAPLRHDERAQLGRSAPFFDHGRAHYLLAVRDDTVVGRLSVHVDDIYNAFQSTVERTDRTGFWGFFECADDQEAAHVLFEAGGAWLATQGRTTMVGPASFTLNDVAGLLVDAHDVPPVVLMAYNPAYYRRLIETEGFRKAHDLWAYRLDATAGIPGGIAEHAASASADGFRIRSIDMGRFDEEVEVVLGLYNEAWERNWGFAPMTRREMLAHAERLRPILDPSLVLVAEHDGEPAGFGLTIPDVNEILRGRHGRLGPVATARLLYTSRRRLWTKCRVVALGVRRAFRRTGLGAALYARTLEAAKANGYVWGEMSWVLESNEAMNSGIRAMGGRRYKTYRMYSRDVGR